MHDGRPTGVFQNHYSTAPVDWEDESCASNRSRKRDVIRKARI